MPYASAVVERTMKVQEVMVQAISGKLTWLEAEEILSYSYNLALLYEEVEKIEELHELLKRLASFPNLDKDHRRLLARHGYA